MILNNSLKIRLLILWKTLNMFYFLLFKRVFRRKTLQLRLGRMWLAFRTLRRTDKTYTQAYWSQTVYMPTLQTCLCTLRPPWFTYAETLILHMHVRFQKRNIKSILTRILRTKAIKNIR